MEEITLVFRSEKGEIAEKESFTGLWLVGGPEEGVLAEDNTRDWDADLEWSVAQKQNGAIVVYERHRNERHRNETCYPRMVTYDSFDDFRSASEGEYEKNPQNIIAKVASALGKSHEIELD